MADQATLFARRLVANWLRRLTGVVYTGFGTAGCRAAADIDADHCTEQRPGDGGAAGFRFSAGRIRGCNAQAGDDAGRRRLLADDGVAAPTNRDEH